MAAAAHTNAHSSQHSQASQMHLQQPERPPLTSCALASAAVELAGLHHRHETLCCKQLAPPSQQQHKQSLNYSGSSTLHTCPRRSTSTCDRWMCMWVAGCLLMGKMASASWVTHAAMSSAGPLLQLLELQRRPDAGHWCTRPPAAGVTSAAAMRTRPWACCASHPAKQCSS